MATFSKALQLAVEAHFNKYDKGGHSYILHPMRIAMRLRTDGEELMSVAILHDTIEDGTVTFTELEEYGFSLRVITAVRLLTHQKGTSYEDYIEAMKGNRDALLVKLQDLRDNSDITRLKGVTEKDVTRMRKYQKAYLRVNELLKECK